MAYTTEQAARRIRRYASTLKRDLVRAPRGILTRPYLAAGIGDTYPDLTDWDAIWSGIGFMLDDDPEPLRNSLLNLIDHIAPDGKGQRRIGFASYSAHPYQIRPFLTSGCYALSTRLGCDWLDELALDRLDSYLLYWHSHRTGRQGLMRWLHVDEGFADNGLANWAWEGAAVEATDLNAQLVREHLALAWILGERGRAERAHEHRELASRLVDRIEACLWQEEYGGYCSLYNPAERFHPSTPIRIRHYTNLWPLWVGISPPERACRVIEGQILDHSRFRSLFGIRSMAASEPHFNNMRVGYLNPMSGAPQTGVVAGSGCSNWQGPVWPVPTWLTVMAMRRYGYGTDADKLVADYLHFLADRLDRDGAFAENYHSETGEPLHAMGMGSWYMLIWWLAVGDDDGFFPIWPQDS